MVFHKLTTEPKKKGPHISTANTYFMEQGTSKMEGTSPYKGILFSKPKTFKEALKNIPRAHIRKEKARIRIMKKTNIRYCTKEDTKAIEKGRKACKVKTNKVKVKSKNIKKILINGPKNN